MVSVSGIAILWVLATLTAATPQIICHRGTLSEAPENTLPALEYAIAQQCDIIEVDVRVTRDDRAILLHDPTLDRTTNGSGPVAALTYEQVRRLDAGSSHAAQFVGTLIPSLEEIVERARGRARLLLDLKVADVNSIVQEIRRLNYIESTIFNVPTLNAAKDIRKHYPASIVSVSLFSLALVPGLIPELAEDHPGIILSVTRRDWTPLAADLARRHNLEVFIRLPGNSIDATSLEKVLALGPTAIQTDRPDVLKKLLRELVAN